jgi:antibiotic biosynthesis monooxygenase (ABM) superfamily enzyme
MHAVVRSYSGQGASELFEQLEQRNEEIKDLIGGVPGFVSYTALRSSEGGATVTVCQDKTGTDESSRGAAEWVNEKNSTMADPPVITEGSTVAYFNS